MVALVVEVADFAGAATKLRHEVAENVRLCVEGLRLPGGLVGVDPAGVAWAGGYDPAARAALAASVQVARAAFRTSLLLAASGCNYDRAETASITGGGSPEVDWGPLLAPAPDLSVPAVASAGGVGSGTPAGWWLIAHTVGQVWPGGHQDKLRATAAAWRSAARGVELATPVPLGILGLFAADRIPEYDGIAAALRSLYDRLHKLVDTYQALAESCEQYATALDECHATVEDELADLAVESLALQAGGAALSIITLGAAEAPTQAAQATRIALAASRVAVLIKRVGSVADHLADGVRTVRALADDITTSLHALATSRVALAGVQQVPRLERLAMVERDAGKAAGAGKTAKAAEAAEAAVKPAATHPGAGFSMQKADREHILDGTNGGGGHRWPGLPGKTPFPEQWSDDQIIGNVEDIVKSPTTKWYAETGSGGKYTTKGKAAKWRSWEMRDGARVRVVWQPATGRIVSAFPDSDAVSGVPIP